MKISFDRKEKEREREKSFWSADRQTGKESLIIQNEQDCCDHKNRFSSHLIDLSEKRREEMNNTDGKLRFEPIRNEKCLS